MIDTHGHLTDTRYDLDRDAIVSDMLDCGVTAFIDSGISLSNSYECVSNARLYDSVYSEIGVHPEYADEFSESDILSFESLAREPKVVGVGEIGLDYHYDGYDKDTQIRVFRSMLEFAHSLSLPVTIHVREAYLDTFTVLRDMRSYLTDGVRLHCYSGSRDMMRQFDTLDCYYSFGGVITFSSYRHQDVLKACPIDRLLIETDCPYLTPTPHRGTLNYPKYLPHVLIELASVLGIDRERLDDITTQNAVRFYKSRLR